MKWILPLLTLLCGLFLGHYFSGGSRDAASIESVRPADAGGVVAPHEADSKQARRSELSLPEEIFSEAWLDAYEKMTPLDRHAAQLEMMRSVTLDDYPRVLDRLHERPGTENWQLQDLIQRQWVAADPRGMQAYLETVDNQYQHGLRNTLYREWAKQDFEAAWAAVMDVPDEGKRRPLIGSVLASGAAKSPQRVLGLLETSEISRGQSSWLYRSVFQELAKSNPALARQRAADMAPGEAKQYALLGSLQEMIKDDFNGALAWLEGLPMDSGVYRARVGVIQQLQSRDFDEIREVVDAQTDPDLRQELLKNVYLHGTANNKSFDEQLEMLSWMESTMRPADLKNKMNGMIYSMAEADLTRTVDYVMSLPYGQSRMNALSSIANKLAQQDLESVFDFADSLSYEDERERVLEGISYQVVRQGIEAAAAFVLEHEESVLQQRIAGQLVREWASYDRDGAIEWMSQLTDKDAFRQAQRELINTWAKEDAAGAAAYIEAEVGEAERERIYSDAISSVAYDDPEAAIAWLSLLPKEGLKAEKDIYRRITSAYVNVDPLAASEWVADLEAGEIRDNSIKALAERVVRFEPDSAFIWANSVDSPSVRKETQMRTIREWADRDPDAAYDAVKDARIDAEEKVPLFKEIEKRSKRAEGGRSEFRSESSPVMISIVN